MTAEASKPRPRNGDAAYSTYGSRLWPEPSFDRHESSSGAELGWQEAVCVLPGGPLDWARRARIGTPISHLHSNTYVWRFALNLKTLIDSRRYGAGSACSICRRISELTQARYGLPDEGVIVARLNRALLGWANYFHRGRIAPAYRAIDAHATKRLRQWLCRKHKVRTGQYVRYSDEHLWEALRLTRLTVRMRGLAWAKGMISNESPVREIRTLGSTSGERKRS